MDSAFWGYFGQSNETTVGKGVSVWQMAE